MTAELPLGTFPVSPWSVNCRTRRQTRLTAPRARVPELTCVRAGCLPWGGAATLRERPPMTVASGARTAGDKSKRRQQPRSELDSHGHSSPFGLNEELLPGGPSLRQGGGTAEQVAAFRHRCQAGLCRQTSQVCHGARVETTVPCWAQRGRPRGALANTGVQEAATRE